MVDVFGDKTPLVIRIFTLLQGRLSNTKQICQHRPDTGINTTRERSLSSRSNQVDSQSDEVLTLLWFKVNKKSRFKTQSFDTPVRCLHQG